MSSPTLGSIVTVPVLDRLDLVADPVAAVLRDWPFAHEVGVVEIDPDIADTAAMSEAYGLSMSTGANCVVVGGRRDGEERVAACLVRADTRADVNNLVKRTLDVRKASFLSMERAVEESAMEYGGITPVGHPRARHRRGGDRLGSPSFEAADPRCAGRRAARSRGRRRPGRLMRRLVLALAAVLVLAGCSDEATPASAPEPSPSISTLTPIALPPPPPPTGKLLADMRQSSRDAAAGRMEVWIYNDTAGEITPTRITYVDPRYRNPLPGT